jgi:hypothetical protein
MTPEEKLEQLLDLIAEALIQSDIPELKNRVNDSQKFIRDGIIQQGAGKGRLALYQKDIKANQEDLNLSITINPNTDEEETLPELQHLANIVDFGLLNISSSLGVDDTVSVYMVGGGLAGGGQDITSLVIGEGNPLNVSQFVPLEQKQSIVDVERAEEYLDTNIFELLPSGDTRQSRIIRFFQELNALLPPDTPQFDLDGIPGVDRLPDGTWSGSVEYSKDNSISYAQENSDGNIDEEEAFIHRLKNTANSINSSRTIEDIYNTILPYLTDIMPDDNQPEDERVEYKNQSSGYLKFRNPNQGIIIRNTNEDFIQGLDPSNPTWLRDVDGGYGTGFTITMWVRFLDKVSEGTLFNYGNPNRLQDPFGFRLETFVIDNEENKLIEDNVDSGYSSVIGEDNPNGALFQNTDTERFVRLMVYDDSFGKVRDSHTANPHLSKRPFLPNLNNPSRPDGSHNQFDKLALFNYMKIPQDFNEWYFICASFNPSIDEDSDFDLPSQPAAENPIKMHNFWMNHVLSDGQTYTDFSGVGNQCKVEIISRTDLLRARGFKV